MKDELVEVKIKQYLGLRAKTCSYLIDDGRKDKKVQNFLQATQLENKLSQLEKNEINVDSLKKSIKNLVIKLFKRSQQTNIENTAKI